MRNWSSYKSRDYSQRESQQMDYELDILHNLVSKLYDDDNWKDEAKATIDKIERVVNPKMKFRKK